MTFTCVWLCCLSFILGLYCRKTMLYLLRLVKKQKEDIEDIKEKKESEESEYETDFEEEDLKMVFIN
jgi:hypothetical protein